jgi:hypothetical protein
MALLPQEGVELIPGYRLQKRLGTGGYGEVWRATAPGGLAKAIKIIIGHMEDARAEQELRSLSRIKDVRHPFLLSLERLEIVDGQLVIVTELADMSLHDRFVECQRAGQRGIPRAELLAYCRDAADALDYMSDQFGLQHLDVKPQNLLLVGGRIKIADFGQVKDLHGTSVTATGGVTPVYAPPEAFDARVSRYSDQYSLAIVYQELLTGVRPFPGTTALQLAAQHTTSPPMLAPLPPHDRPVIGRSLAKVPEQRFASCRELVESLMRPSAAPLVGRAPAARESGPASGPASTAVVHLPPEPVDEEELFSLATDLPAGPAGQPEELAAHYAATPAPPRQSGTAARLRPTLFLGVGGLACGTLKRLRQRLHDRFGDLAAVPVLRLLLLDTDRATIQRAHQGGPGEALTAAETLLAPLRPAEHYRDQTKDLLRWLDRRFLYGIPRSLLTEGLRPLGRLALMDNAEVIRTRLREALTQLTSAEAREAAAATLGAPLRTEAPRVFLVASVAGGTGSGMLVDLAYAVRHVLEELQLPTEGLCGLLLHATSQKPASRDLARINAAAALQELHHFSRPDGPYPGDPAHGLAAFGPGVPPLEDCYLVHLGDQLDESAAQAATDPVAAYLDLDAATVAGTFLDEYRQRTRVAAGGAAAGPALRSFGLSRICFSRDRLAKTAADHLCLYLLDRWRGAAADRMGVRHELGALPQVCTEDLAADTLEKRLPDAAQAIWGEEPGTVFRRLLASSALLEPASKGPPRTPAELAAQVLPQIEELLGSGEGPEPEREPVEVAFQAALWRQAEEHGAALSRAVVTWLRGMVEDPTKRLKAADRAARWLEQRLLCESDILRTRFAHFSGQRALLRGQLAAGEVRKKGSGVRWLGLRRAPQAITLAQSYLDYCWLRFHESILESGLHVLGTVSAHLTEFTQELARCRRRLEECAQRFQASLTAPIASNDQAPALHNLTEVFPDRIENLAQAAAACFHGLGTERLSRFEQRVQEEVLNPHGGLWGLVEGDRDPAEVLQDPLQVRAQSVFLQAVSKLDAAGLFLASQDDAGMIQQALTSHVQAAAPRLLVAGSWPHLVLAVPDSSAGAALGDAVRQALPNLPTTVLISGDNVILFQEAVHFRVPEVVAALAGTDTSYAENAHRALTRADVAWSAMPAAEGG